MTAATNLTYLRGLLPEDAFEDISAYGMSLKSLKRGVSKAGDTLIDWFEQGCFDAIERGYLKTIVLGVYVDPNDPRIMLETYTFNVTYNQEGRPDVIVKNSEKVVAHLKATKNEVEKASVQLMRTLCLFTQTLAPLPDERYLTMKLHYYDEVTPHEYNPPMFRSGLFEESVFLFKHDPTKLRLGYVDSQHHTMEMKVYTNVEEVQEEAKKPEEIIEEAFEVKPEGNNHQESVELECICECNHYAVDLVKCSICSKYQHRACIGTFQGDCKCFNCQWPEMSTDIARKIHDFCLIRHALKTMFEEKKFTMRKYCVIMKIPLSTAHALIGTFVKQHGFVRNIGRKFEVNLSQKTFQQYKRIMSMDGLREYVPQLSSMPENVVDDYSENLDDDEAEIDLDCMCGFNNYKTELVQCKKCLHFKHSACMGEFVDGECFKCKWPNLSKKESQKLQNFCMFRHALTMLFKEKKLAIEDYCEKMGINFTGSMQKKALLHFMLENKYVSRSSKALINATTQVKYKHLMSMQGLYEYIPALINQNDFTDSISQRLNDELYFTQKTLVLDSGKRDFVPDSQPSMLDDATAIAPKKRRKVSMASTVLCV